MGIQDKVIAAVPEAAVGRLGLCPFGGYQSGRYGSGILPTAEIGPQPVMCTS